ncbi:SLBB domain-containing protein [Emticicia sp. BO119]|uniref:polysaccharide biosynthesis/export family protein n=1 Tax=Emticicia sp. BO119 TaxID=2757768 RepID=UPI0015F06B5D|nr:SLBB domain-containing protein [Emticicia sp. BO119]MBA4853649.1 SLBB domain-containing protein [Emticicia sp. BO119]
MTSSKFFYKVIILLVLGFFEAAYSQTPTNLPSSVDNLSDKQIETFLKEAESRGLSEAQIEAAALANGYSAQDIAKVRERINRLKTGTSEVKANAPGTAKLENVTREQIGEVAQRTSVAVSDKQEVGKKLETFGSQLFNNKNLTFEPNLRLPTPKGYILGPDDEIKIDITGYAYQHYDAKVTPEGTIKIENLAPIYVNGNTIDQAKAKIIERLKTIFAGLRDGRLNADITLGNVRSIKVTLVGEVTNPGTYTISSLASAFNALYLSGGPNINGSFRNIQVFRNNALIKKIDIYDFLLKGTLEDNITLFDQDVILVPLFQKKVKIEGEVKRSGIFELNENDDFSTLLNYAGGYTEQAFTSTVNVHRNTKTEKKILTFDPLTEPGFATKNGDQFYVGTILDRFENKVEVRGAVFRPGEFALGDKIKTVKQLIENAQGLREDAYANRAILVREQDNLDLMYIPIDLSKLLKGEIPDIDLKRQDQLLVKSIVEIRQERKIDIEGAVNNPGNYSYAENMSIRDVILLAGGFSDGATSKRIEVGRRQYNDESSEKSVEIIQVNISKDLNPAEGGLKLMPFDKIFVRNLPNYEVQQTVFIEGEVNYPGAYIIESKTERLSDLIDRAGGLRSEAYIAGSRLYRNDKLIFVDFEKALKNKKTASNLLLENGDRVEISKERQTVSINGQVLNPTRVAYQPNFSFGEYIAQAGGFTDSAFVKKTYVQYANGSTDRTRSFFGIKVYPKVQQGMSIYVPTRNRMRMSPAERIAIGTGFVSLSAVLLTLVRLL